MKATKQQNVIVKRSRLNIVNAMNSLNIKHIALVVFCFAQVKIFAQTHDQTSTPSESHNYIHTIVPTVPVYLISETRNANEYDEKVSYFDGLGRPLQEVQVAASPTFEDIITPFEYDTYGRETESYLPFSTKHLSSNTHGAIVSPNQVISNQRSFYQQVHSGDQLYAFSKKTYEPNPLNRALSETAPGYSWHTNNKAVSYEYEIINNESIPMAEIIEGQTFNFSSDFESHQLLLNRTIDENNSKTETIVNKLGQTIMKRNILSETTGDLATTYYVYDIYNNLRLVIPPEGWKQLEEMLQNSTLVEFSKRDDLVNRWCFYYEYDHRNRMIEKKVPGAEPVYMIYDSRDRLILTQDGNQRGNIVADGIHMDVSSYVGESYTFSNGGSVNLTPGFETGENFEVSANASGNNDWSFTKYDQLNRPVMTGVISLSGSVSTIRQTVANISDFSVVYNGSSSLFGYDNTSYPASGQGVNQSSILTVTYYDNHNFLTEIVDFNDSSFDLPSNNMDHIGLVTGGMTRILGGNMIPFSTYYDSRKRVISSVTKNHLGGQDVIENTYLNVISNVTTSDVRHHSTDLDDDGILEVSKSISNKYQYDHMNRLKTTTTTIGTKKSVTALEYNELGQMVEKDLNDIQSVDYAYNIRGWMTHINGGTTFDDTDDVFGMELLYDNSPTGYQQYNGNIGQIKWKSTGAKTSGNQDYKYSYDALNRLKTADYTGSSKNFDMSASYDLNGNIETLSRYMYKVDFGANKLIDQLIYTYGTSGNQLREVKDNGDAAGFNNSEYPSIDKIKDFGFNDGNTSGDDYLYDANGNMTQDLNKGITKIKYNILNLPEEITIDNKSVNYVYDAAGMKLSKTDQNGKVYDYIGGIHYEKEVSESSELEFIQTPEGRFIETSKNYQYNITDHLGNVRSLIQSKTTTQTVTKTHTIDGPIDLGITGYTHEFTLENEASTLVLDVDFSGEPFSEPSIKLELLDHTYKVLYTLYRYYEDDGHISETLTGLNSDGAIVRLSLYDFALYDLVAENIVLTETNDNVKVKEVEIVQADDYYPFGMTFNSYTSGTENLYKYNNKEEQKETEWLDYGWRMYQPDLGRFFTKDRFTEKYYDMNPYQYGANNPILYVDIQGDSIIKVTINDQSGYIHGASELYIDHRILSDVKKILNLAAATETHIRINSSFRTNKKQEEIQGGTGLTPAQPGNSAHNAGLAIDFNVYNNNDPEQGIMGQNANLTDENAFIDGVKNDKWITGWRWGGDFNDPDPIHIDKKNNSGDSFESIRDANQAQMNGNIESANNDGYVSYQRTMSIGGTQSSRRLQGRLLLRSTTRQFKKTIKSNISE